jgi:hypothetical protein
MSRDSYGLEPEEVWSKVLYPAAGAYHVFVRNRYPVAHILDSQLEEGRLEGTWIIFVPDFDTLSDKMKAVLNDFESKGGRLIKNKTAWKWHDPTGWDNAVADFNAALKKAGPPPIEATGGNRTMHCNGYYNPEKQRLTIALVNDFTWVSVGGKQTGADAAPPCMGAKVHLRGPYGKRPMKLFNAMTRKELKGELKGNELVIEIPPFEQMVIVVAEGM